MKRMLSAVLLAAALLLLGACKAAPAPAPDSVVGTWEDSYGLTEYRFDSGGSMRLEALNFGSFKGTYRIDGSKITIEYKVVVKKVTDTYEFRVDGDTLYLNDREFRRKD